MAPLAAADAVVLAAPVDAILAILPRLPALTSTARFITDTGSTKHAIVLAAAEAGAEVLKRYFRSGGLRVEAKAQNDFVTQADRESEAALVTLQAMQERHPHNVQVLRLLQRLYRERGDWSALILLREARASSQVSSVHQPAASARAPGG